jgi:WD40 repeat protein
MNLITTDTATRLALGLAARCTFIKRAAWANDGQTLVVAHGSGLSVWMGGFDERPDHVFASEAPMRAVAASPLGPMLAAAGHDGRIRLWNTLTWQRDRAMPIQLHKGAVSAIGFHPARWIIASGDSTGYAAQVDLDSGRFMRLIGHTKEISRIVYSPDARQIATGSWDGTARLFNATTGAALHVLEHGAWVRWAAFSTDGTTLATACTDGSLRLWNTADGTIVNETPAHSGGFDTLALSPDGSLLVTGGRDGALRVWDAATLAPLVECPNAHDKPVLTLVFRPQGDFLISGGGDNWLRLWEVPADPEDGAQPGAAAD